jgi:hypothetical protein
VPLKIYRIFLPMTRQPMTSIKVDFEWTRGRYECAPSHGNKTRFVIRQMGNWKERFRPLELPSKTSLAVTFANLDGSREQCLNFANSYGLLTIPAREDAAEFLKGPESWQREIKKMRALLHSTEMVRTVHSRRIHFVKMTTLDVGLVSGLPNTSPTLIMSPPTLLAAMIVQAAQAKASGISFRGCMQCANLFEQGTQAKRSVAKFCSTSCRNRFHYEKRIQS